MQTENRTERTAKSRIREQPGFTIVELTVVLSVLLIALITMFYNVDRSLRTSNEVYRLTSATFLAERKMEEVRARASCYTADFIGGCPFTGSRFDFQGNFSQGPPGCTFPAPFEQFKCRVFYVDASNASGGGLAIAANFIKEIQVRVWFDENYNNICDATETDVLFQTALTYASPAWPN